MTSTRFDPRRPFLSADAQAAGITRATLRGPSFRTLFRGCYIAADVPVTDHLLARAALTAVPSAYGLSGHSAARALGLTVPHDDCAHLAVPAGKSCRLEGITVRRYDSPPPMVVAQGLPATAPVCTFLDLATELNLVDLVVLGDEMVRYRMVTPERLVRAAGQQGVRGSRLARRAAGLVRVGVDSVMESRTRMLLVLAGLPEPVVNFEIRRRDGSVWRRIDLSYPEARLAIEYDGRHHIDRREQWHQDLARREELERLDWRFVVLTSEDIYVQPHETLMRTTRAMGDKGMRVPVLREDWRRHFPGRAKS